MSNYFHAIYGQGGAPTPEPEDLSPVLLWTNPSLSADFEGQKVSVDLTDYVGAIVEYTSRSTASITSRSFVKKSDTLDTLFGSGYYDGGNGHGRNITAIDNSGITFGDSYYGSSDNNGFVKPYKIYGVKEYVAEPFKPVDATVCERAYIFPATSGTTNTWTVEEGGLYLIAGNTPGIEDNRGSISFIGEATLISGNDIIRVFTAKTGAQVKLTVDSENTFTPYINIIK